MKIELDAAHAKLVEEAVARGEAADAVSFVQQAIAEVLTPYDLSPEMEALLLERLEQEPRQRPDDWREQIRERATHGLNAEA